MAIAVAACLMAFTGNAAAPCERHFYNNSSAQYSLVYDGERALQHLPGLHDQSALDRDSNFTSPYPAGNVLITSSYTRGSTGEIAVNDPADGDVTTCGSSGWNCPTTYSHRAPRGQRK